MASKKHIKQGGKLSGERHSDEQLLSICMLRSVIQMENWEPVSSITSEQVLGYATPSECAKLLHDGDLINFEGDGIERPIETREEVYPRTEQARKSGRKKTQKLQAVTIDAPEPQGDLRSHRHRSAILHAPGCIGTVRLMHVPNHR